MVKRELVPTSTVRSHSVVVYSSYISVAAYENLTGDFPSKFIF